MEEPSREIVEMRVDHTPSPLLVCGWWQGEAEEIKVHLYHRELVKTMPENTIF